MGGSVSLRPAARSDADAVCAIYNEGIAGRQATFEIRRRGVDEVREWFDDELPFIVAVDSGGRVLGWARVSASSDRCVYEGVGEHGVYVDESARGHGVGTRLLEEVAATSERLGFYKLTSRVFTTNNASLAAGRTACWSSGFSGPRASDRYPRPGRLMGDGAVRLRGAPTA